MSQTYGTTLKWSTVGAPQPCTSILENFSYRSSKQQHLEDDAAANLAAVILHGLKGAISFGGTITDATVDLPDLSAGALIEVDADETETGIVLCSSLVEEWAIGSPKKFSGSATHYPDAVQGAGSAAGALSGATPVQNVPVIKPAGKVIWGTSGLTSTTGTIQRLRIEQTLVLTEETDGAGKIITITAHRYMRKINLEVLALASATLPANDSTLAVAGAPAHASDYVITDSEIKWQRGRGAMISVDAMWFPGMVPAEDPEP